MHPASYYLESRPRAPRGLANTLEMLREMARDYDDIAEDLECGAIEMRHPELMPQRRQ